MTDKVYVAPETAITFADSDQTPDANLTMTALSSGGARISAQHDIGAGSHSEYYKWRLTVQFETDPVVDETIEIYAVTSDGTDEDGQEGTSDADLGSTDSLKNMDLIGILTVTSTDADHDMTASGLCRIPDRYISIVIYNNTADALKTSTSVHTFTLTPIPPEIQTA